MSASDLSSFLFPFQVAHFRMVALVGGYYVLKLNRWLYGNNFNYSFTNSFLLPRM